MTINLIDIKHRVTVSDQFSADERDFLLEAVSAFAGEHAVERVNQKLFNDCVAARRQNEHMLATIRKLYEDVRAEQTDSSDLVLLPMRRDPIEQAAEDATREVLGDEAANAVRQQQHMKRIAGGRLGGRREHAITVSLAEALHSIAAVHGVTPGAVLDIARSSSYGLNAVVKAGK